MAKKTSEEKHWNQFLYGNWDPHSHSLVWLENGAYAELERQLSYYREHPTNVRPEELLQFLSSVMEEWRKDTNKFKANMEEILAQYDRMLDAMKSREKEYKRLKALLQDLNKKIKEQEQRQEQIERRLTLIENERFKAKERALELKNEAIDAFNGIVNDPFCQKYAMSEIEAIDQQLKSMDTGQLASEAIQAVAVNALNRVYVVTMLVERRKLEFSAAQLLAETEATMIFNQFVHWRDDIYFDDARQHKADMDFWSFQHFSEVMSAVENLCQRIRSGERLAGYMVANLENDIRQMKELQEEGERTVASVFNSCNISEQCQQLGLLTAIILYEDFHFQLVTNGYDEDDLRHGYVIEMENHAMGCKIRFVFSPVSQTQSVGCYQMCFHDYIDQQLLSSFEQVLLSELQNNGIAVSKQCEAGKQTWDTVVENIEFTPHGEPIILPEGMRMWEYPHEHKEIKKTKSYECKSSTNGCWSLSGKSE